MAKTKLHYYVLVFTDEGPMYVTKVDNSTQYSYWDDCSKPYEFGSREYATDTALGLSWNNNNAVALVVPWIIENQPYRYSEYDCAFIRKESCDED